MAERACGEPMSDGERRKLAAEAIVTPGWRWFPGMRTLAGDRVLAVMAADGVRTLTLARMWTPEDWVPGEWGVFRDASGACLPDFSDEGTRGGLLACVREAWRARGGHVFVRPPDHPEPPTEDLWETFVHDPDEYSLGDFTGATEEESLVAALKGAADA